MKHTKFLFLLICTLIFTTAATSCVDNSDPDPPVPPIYAPVTIDDLIGTWETYYSTKRITVMYTGQNSQTYPEYRDIYYDGFKERFWKEIQKTAEGKDTTTYKFESIKPTDAVIFNGTFSLDKDTIIFNFKSKTTGNDTITKAPIDQRKSDKNIGVTVVVFPSHRWFLNEAGTQYIGKVVTEDIRHMRNMQTAPNYNGDVFPKKVEFGYEKIIGKWEIYDVRIFINGNFDALATKEGYDALKGTTYTYQQTATGKKECIIHETGRVPYLHDVYKTDDVFNLIPVRAVSTLLKTNSKKESYLNLFKRLDWNDNSSRLKTKNNVVEESGEEDKFMWVTDWKNRIVDGKETDTFIDKREIREETQRASSILSEYYFKRIE